MKITVFLNETGIAGGVKIILHFADELRQRGHDVQIVSLPWRRPSRRAYLKGKIKSGIKAVLRWPARLGRPTAPAAPTPERRMSTSHLDLFPPFRHRQLEAYRAVTDADFPDADVIIATWRETALMLAKVAPSKGIKVHFFQQYDANFNQPAASVEAAWRLPARKIVCSQWLADLAANQFNDPTAVVVNNGIDLGLFDAPPRGKQPIPTVGVMYSASPPKSWPTALAVLIEAQRRLPNLRILTFGFAPPRQGSPLPPGASFELLPEQTRIREIYTECDAWLCASSSEGFHLPPHEAMACRTPVVSTRVGGPMDMITECLNGFLAEPFDEATLTTRLLEFLTMPEARWCAMSDQAYAVARQFTWKIAGDRFEATLQEVALHAGEPAAL